MKAGVVALAGLGVLALGGVALAASQDKETQPVLPPPPKGGCSSAADVGKSTTDLLADPSITADGYRNAANVLRTWPSFCDDEARNAAQVSIVLLEGKANTLEGSPAPPPQVPDILGSSVHPNSTGLHGETGTAIVMANGDTWFFPSDVGLAPYFVPFGSTDIHTSGFCCSSCARGEECEGCG